MTNKEAINSIKKLRTFHNGSYAKALDMAIKTLKGKDTDVHSRKGVFIPDITVEMFRNASLEGVEELMASGEMEDISLPSAEPNAPDTNVGDMISRQAAIDAIDGKEGQE